MEMYNAYKSDNDVQELSLEDMFSKLFSKLIHYDEEEQRQKILEINELVEEMNKEEHKSFFTKIKFNRIDKMIEIKKMSMENALLLLKHIGHHRTSKRIFINGFVNSSLCFRFEQMIADENEKKKERKNEKLLIELCECFLLINEGISSKLLSICVPCLLRFVLNKERNDEAQKEVEMALLALSNIHELYKIEKELYFNEIKDIIEYHQEHRNLTQLAYQCAWLFLLNRLRCDNSLEDVIANELHFGREATRELEELTRNANWKKKEEEMSKEEANEVLIIKRWVKTLMIYFFNYRLRNKELVDLFRSIIQVYRTAKDNCRGIGKECIYSLRNAAGNFYVKIEYLLRSGAISAVLEEIQRPTIVDKMAKESLLFFTNVSNRLKEKKKNEMEEEEEEEEFDEGDEERDDEKEEEKEEEEEGEEEEEERKITKRKVFEKMEEEGYEDIITSFHEALEYFKRNYYRSLSLNISDYLVNV